MKRLLTLPREVFLHHAKHFSPQLTKLVSPPGAGAASNPSSQHQQKMKAETSDNNPLEAIKGESWNYRIGTSFDKDCGCICQLQLYMDHEANIYQARAATRKIKLDSTKQPEISEETGKFVLGPCDCEINNTLSSVLASQSVGKPIEYVGNDMFSPAASPEFHRTLVRNLGLGSDSIHCVKLVERAAAQAYTERSDLGPAAQDDPFGTLAHYKVQVQGYVSFEQPDEDNQTSS